MGDSSKPAPEALRKDVEAFDHSKLKEVEEKAVTPSQTRDMTMAGKGDRGSGRENEISFAAVLDVASFSNASLPAPPATAVVVIAAATTTAAVVVAIVVAPAHVASVAAVATA